jgi:UDP:flavonoid glycosyltransferase YjiC (YdhE family)
LARILFTTFGSYGDLHPFLAVALGMRARGHDCTIAASEFYRAKVEGEGIEFAPVRPDVGALTGEVEFAKKLWDPRKGPELLLRNYVIPQVEQSYEDLYAASAGADFLVSHSATYAGPIVAEVRKLPWASFVLQPSSFFSAWDPPVLPPAPLFHHLRSLGYAPFSLILDLAKQSLAQWTGPVRKLRKKLGLPKAPNPIFEGQFSPLGTVALFSEYFAKPQPDWPLHSKCVGFPFYDREQAGHSMDSALDEFLALGPPPVVFTLGSSAVYAPGGFYAQSLAAAQKLGVRAVLLTGIGVNQKLPAALPAGIFATPYAPYSELFPQAAATVHQGGIGTTAQALRSGRPMLVAPWSFDQPDNARRVRRLGVARTIKRDRFKAAHVAHELSLLLLDEEMKSKAAKLGRLIRQEDGVSGACDELQRLLDAGQRS